MHAFQELQSQVDNGSLRIIQLVGVPRSMSTAFGRALNESEVSTVYVNEPFNRKTSSIDQAASSLLEAYYRLDEVNSTQGVVITKNMASYLPPRDFDALDSLASTTIWNIRHPYIQMGSLLTRLVNDLNIGLGENRIEQPDIYPYLDQATEYLLDSPKSYDFSKTGWSAIGALAIRSQTDSLAVDGQIFTNNPADCLREACLRVTLPYQPSMHTAWKRPLINVINKNDAGETKRSAWTSDVARATGVVAAERAELDLERVPDILRAHILDVALPTYTKLLNQVISIEDTN